MKAHVAGAEPRSVHFRVRRSVWLLARCDAAAIRSDFAHRFFVARQEVCAERRAAAIARLEAEQQAALKARYERAAAQGDMAAASEIAPATASRRDRRQGKQPTLRQARTVELAFQEVADAVLVPTPKPSPRPIRPPGRRARPRPPQP
jgi:hypothetical protein